MGCNESVVRGPLTLWTAKSTAEANAVFHPRTGAVDTVAVRLVRTSMEMAQSSVAITVKPAYRTSNDKVTWGTPTVIGSQSLSADGSVYGASFVDLATALADDQFVQFGVIAFKSSGTQVELAVVGLKLDIKAS